MGTLLNRRRYMGGRSLPYDAEIEYLEATGTQYIDTLFYPRTTNPNIKAEVKFNKSVLAGDQCVLGARNGTSGNAGYKLPNFYGSTLEYQGIIPSGRADLTGYNIDTDYTSIAEIKRGEQKIYINGVLQKETTYDSDCDSRGTLYLFAIRQNNKWFFKGKIYYCKIWQDDVLERDFIPVRVGQVGYMYDRVSGQLFGNAGTGDFVLGQDVVTIMTTETNPEVLAVCYAQGWCAIPDKMTSVEAKAVTTIGTVFRNNTSITHFEEFEYFTNVTRLDQYAFNKCSNLETISLPTSVTEVQYNAFGECSKLTTVDGLDNVTTIGGAAFYSCSKLDGIVLSANLSSLNAQIFLGCSSLTQVTLPSGVTSVPNQCFRECSSLSAFTTLGSVTSIGERAFNNAGISQVDLSAVVSIGNAAFEGSKVTSIDIGEDCTSIADAAFYNCKQLQYVIIRATTPPTLANGNHAFTNGSSNYPIYVPDSAYETYLAATNWSYYSTRIKKISEKP